MNLYSGSTDLSQKECILSLVMLGWEHRISNLLIKPKSFKLNASIAVDKEGYFLFIENKADTVILGDTLAITSVEDEFYIRYSPGTMLLVVIDNTYET